MWLPVPFIITQISSKWERDTVCWHNKIRVILHKFQNTSLLNNVDLARLSWNPGNSHRILYIPLLMLMWWSTFAILWYVFQSLSHVQLFATPWTAALQASLFSTISQNLLRLMSIESVMPSDNLILSSPSPPAFNFSQHQGLFQWVSSSHQVAKVILWCIFNFLTNLHTILNGVCTVLHS